MSAIARANPPVAILQWMIFTNHTCASAEFYTLEFPRHCTEGREWLCVVRVLPFHFSIEDGGRRFEMESSRPN